MPKEKSIKLEETYKKLRMNISIEEKERSGRNNRTSNKGHDRRSQHRGFQIPMKKILRRRT
jgi:hypothetical protein